MWRAFWANLVSKLLSTVFSPFWREKFWWVWRENTQTHLLFSFLLIQPNTLQKFFSSYFIFKVFHPPYFLCSNKHTHRLSSLSNAKDTTYATTFATIYACMTSCEWWSKSGGFTTSSLTTCHVSKLWQKLWWKLCPKHYFSSFDFCVSVCNCVD